MRRALQISVSLWLAFVTSACGDFSGSSSESLAVDVDPFFDLSAQAGGVEAFETTLHPLLRSYCVTCHEGNGPGSPHFALPNAESAYQALVGPGKVSLSDPAASRVVVKVGTLHHECGNNCSAWASEMTAAIEDWADAVNFDDGGVNVEGALTSASLRLDQGIVDTSTERYRGNLIAFYEFKEGAGAIAHDTSGVAPAMDLAFNGKAEWLGNWGVELDGGALFTDDASKLYGSIADPVSGTQQYTIEAWVTPANIVQNGPARIVSYSRNLNERNVTLGQVQYTYDVRNRSIHPNATNEGRNGEPALRTADADEDAQDRLQHVVLTYDPFRGRRIYVDAEWTGDADELGPARLWNWTESYRFVLGNEANFARPWAGQIRLVAVYRQSLTDAQIRQNYEAGVGERLLMRFDVSQWMGAGATVDFTVSEFDAYSYLFCQPTLRSASPNGSRISNLRIAVNGVVATTGQAFETLEASAVGTKQELSRQCAVIPRGDQGSDDFFTLLFEHLGGFQNIVVRLPFDLAPVFLDGEDRPESGMRDFDRINASFAAVTEQDSSLGAPLLDELESQLPPSHDPRSFVSSQQVAITNLALEYCDGLVESAERVGYFPDLAWEDPPELAYGNAAGRAALFGPLFDHMVVGGLVQQPTRGELDAALHPLIDQLTSTCLNPGDCDAAQTQAIAKAACTAVLSSAAVTLH